MTARVFVCFLALIAAGPSAAAKKVDVSSSDASSTYPDENNISYDAGRTSDGKLSTAWVEGKTGSGLGEWVELDLGGEEHVHKLKVWGGMWYSREYWSRSNRPKEIEVRFSDGSTETMVLSDEMKPAELVLSSPKATSTLQLKIKAVYPGTTWLDTPISEVQVFNGEPEEGAAVRSVSASSVLPPDPDGNYDADNAIDGLTDSMWCEGTEGDGTGESIEFHFAGTQKVGTLHLINGIGTGLPYWMKANRATGATLQFSDGSTADVQIRNTMLPQEISFPPRLTSQVKVTFTTVVAGKEYNDLCVSEAHFQ